MGGLITCLFDLANFVVLVYVLFGFNLVGVVFDFWVLGLDVRFGCC